MSYTGYKPQDLGPMPGAAGAAAGAAQGINNPSVPNLGGLGAGIGANVGTGQSQFNFGTSNPMLDALSGLLGQVFGGPATAGLADQLAGLFFNQDYLGDQQNLARNEAQAQYGFSMRDVGLQGQQLGIEQGALNRRPAYLAGQHGLAQQGFDQAQQQSWQNAQRQQWGINSQETAKGAYGSVGHNRGLGNIQQDLQNSLTTIDRQRKGEQLSYNEQVATTADSQKQLGVMQDRLGLSKDEIAYRLNDSLQRLGLSGAMNAETLLEELGKIQAGSYSPIQSMLGTIYSMSGLNVGAG